MGNQLSCSSTLFLHTTLILYPFSLRTTDSDFFFFLADGPQFEEPQQPAGYTQVSAAAMPPPGPTSWTSESHKPAPPASVPRDMANMAGAFTVQQNPPPGSATPSLSSCSTVRTRREAGTNRD